MTTNPPKARMPNQKHSVGEIRTKTSQHPNGPVAISPPRFFFPKTGQKSGALAGCKIAVR